MLQDPRPIKPLQHALCEVLENLGIEFLPSQWQMQEALLEPAEEAELAQLQAYLKACNIPHRIFNGVEPQEIQHLGPNTIAMTHTGQPGLLKDLESTGKPTVSLLWALQIESGNTKKQPSKQAILEEQAPASLWDFWRKLRESKWLREALNFENGSFKPVIYASLLINILALAGPLFSLQVYDRIIPNQAYASMAALLLGVAICLGFEHALKHARHRLMEIAATSIDTRCTGRLSQSLLNVPIHKTEPTILLQHLRSFEHLRELITGVFLLALIDLPFLVLFLAVIGLIHPLFLLLAGGVIGLTLLFVVSSHRSLSRLGQIQMKQSRETQSQWLDSLACLDNIQAHGVQQAHSKLLNKLQLKARMGGNAVRDQLFLVNQRIHLLQQGSWVITIAMGVVLIVEKQMTVGGLIAVSMLTMRCFAPIQKLQGHLVQTHSAQASFEELDKFLGQEIDTANARSALPSIEHLSLDSASVLKPGHTAESGQASSFILRSVSMNLPAGSRIGIIGPTGSGKTSVLKVLAQQLQCDQGTVAANHLSIDHYHPGEYSSKVGYASQPPVLIKGSLLDNIRFMRPQIDTTNCWKILQELGLKDWVEQHPDGLHMQIESQGNNLSSGQKQAVSLCRALAGEPQLVLLDEPTVCLDQFMENKLVQYLQKLGDKTILVFTTHKLSLLACANSLVLMNQGQIHSQGPKPQVLHDANALAKNREQKSQA
ncbi:ATP-binding cassette domain-containing protein [Limnobacter parvus]|uniref:ATP-binding cassette domain-containing protein n=1 Tax=Limnobacter parvus TaxID=2939690 RepID=A0ABT1XHV9_9BURK|nr:ATP-binding cassette domain-containing protein [Limnobacter parvus]MCR2746878.1 ATP-binding cassette domain-containing protein [Limnobacter parvus]